MNTAIFKIDNENIDSEKMSELGKIIRSGGLVAFPTETVYGLGADAFNETAVKNIFAAKGRPADNPLIVHFSQADDVEDVCYVTPDAKKLFEKFSPGPLTVILKKKDCMSRFVTAGLDTVAVRIPSNKTARALISASHRPIAAPSANISGKPSPTTAQDVIEDMLGRIDAIIDGCDCDVGVESTVVDMTGDHPVILRPGGITITALRELFPESTVDKHVLASVAPSETPKCPGMKYKHYAPNAEVTVIEGQPDSIYEKINEFISENSGKKIGILSMGKSYPADAVLYAGCDNKQYAKNLFHALREFDRLGIDIVFAEFINDDEYGLAVRNRLYKSAAGRVIHV